MDSYQQIGIVLLIIGLCFALFSYFVIGSIPFTSIGLSALILGATIAGIARVRPVISFEGSQILLKTGIENTDALLREFGIKNKAIYLPADLRGEYPQALIMVGADIIPKIEGKLSGSMLVKCGLETQDMALAVTNPGNVSLAFLQSKPGATAEEIESAISYILTGVMDIAYGVRVNLEDLRVIIEIRKAKIIDEGQPYYECLGSLAASIAAAVSSEALNKPVRIIEETNKKGRCKILLEVLEALS